MKRLEDLLPSERMEDFDDHLRWMITQLSYQERRMDDMDEKMTAVMKKMDDFVAYMASVVDDVEKAIDYLRTHQDSDAKAFATHMADKIDEAAAKLGELHASGGVSE